MLVLFETPAGFALFKVLNEGKLEKIEVILLVVFVYLDEIMSCSHLIFV